MEVLFVKKIINYIIIYIFDFIISANICYNLTHIIKNNIKLEWNLNVFHSFIELKDISLLFGTIFLSTIIILFILKYDKELKLKLQKLKKMQKEDGSYEYGSSRWATKKEIKKEIKVWNIGSKLSSGGIPVTFMDGKYYYSDSFDHTLIIGSTGSGKTICNILPFGYAGESMVINDTKGEIYSNTIIFLKKQGYTIKVINLRDAFTSD